MMDEIMNLLKLFIPGAICIKFFSFLHEKKEYEYKYFIYKSVVISGLIVYPLQTICKEWNDFILFLCAVIIGILVSYVAVKIIESDMAQKLLQKVHIRKTMRRFWDDVIDMDGGSYADVKIKGETNRYVGSVEYVEDKSEGDIFISIINFRIITPDGKNIKQKPNTRLVFNTAHVERIVIESAQEKKQ